MPNVELPASTTALILIDLQRAILGRTTAPHSAADVVTRSAALAKRFREKHAVVALVHVDIAHARKPLADEPAFPPNAPPPPPDAMEFAAELGQQPSDLVITKNFYDAFIDTDLELRLRSLKIKTIVLCGISTNAGVESTARTAAALGFDLVIVEDATSSSMGEEAHRFAVTKIFPRFARVRKAEEIALTDR